MSDDARRGSPHWLLIVLALVAVAALAFAVGRFTMFGTGTAEGPPSPGTHSADAGFARDMQVHHQQAVQMAMAIYRTTDDETLRTMATDIITAQSAQAGEMYGWLVEWGLPQSGDPLMTWMEDSAEHAEHGSASMTDAERRAAMGMATDEQLAALRTATGTEADCLFLDLMIRHHEGALDMVDAIETLGTVPRVKAVAESMGQIQGGEIVAMQEMQQQFACPPSS